MAKDIVPQLMIAPAPMKEPAKGMCAECPLARTSKRGYLGGYNSIRYVDIMHGPASIACHMSKGFPKGIEGLPEQRHCTGVAHYRANVVMAGMGDTLNLWGSALEAARMVGPSKEAFSNPTEFHMHHNPGLKAHVLQLTALTNMATALSGDRVITSRKVRDKPKIKKLKKNKAKRR